MKEKELHIVLTNDEYRFHGYCYEIYSPNGKYHPKDKKIENIHIVKYIKYHHDFRLFSHRIDEGDVLKRIVLDTKFTTRHKMHLVDILRKLEFHQRSFRECDVYELASDDEQIKLASLPDFVKSEEYRKVFMPDIEKNDEVDLLITSILEYHNA